MAKTKRSSKSKNQAISQSLTLRIIMLFILFLSMIGVMKLGPIGIFIHTIIKFLFGSVYGIIFLGIFIFSLYVIFKGKIPRLSGPIGIGLYMVFLSFTLLCSIPGETDIKGLTVIFSYIQEGTFNQGGFLGVMLYGLFSTLFDRIGALIFGVFLFIVGMLLIGSKTYFNTKKLKKLKIKQHNEPLKEKKGKMLQELFVQNNENKEPKIIKEDKVSSELEFNDTELKLDIKEFDNPKKEEIVEKEDVIEVISKKTKVPSHYELPPLSILSTQSTNNSSKEKTTANKNAIRLTSVLKEFGVNATIENAFIGPTVTKYELKLETGTRVNKVLQLQDDIKLALATADVRIEAPIPGKPYVGIEVPNHSSSIVSFKDCLKTLSTIKKYADNKCVVCLGKDVSGRSIYGELDKMIHLLVAGATGSGKSVCINTIICSILMRARPDEVKLILVDPKKVELSGYNGIPHLLTPVVTDPKKAAGVLRIVVEEMERRYDVFAKANTRNITSYNDYAKIYNSTRSEDEHIEILPYMVVILDEVADLMMVASKDVEDCIMRLAQMARAAGIHLIVATQRPSTDIITGDIKANIPSRIAFAVSSSIDSRTILDTGGAEKLIGKGDMLFAPMGSSSPTRIQGCYVSDDEVEAIVKFVSSQQNAIYDDKYSNIKDSSSSSDDYEQSDEEYEMCREFVIKAQKASTSLLQRKFRIGYNKAARIIDQLEADGIIGPQMGSKPREVYVRQYNEE